MTSSPQHSQPETSRDLSILIDRTKVNVTLKQFCDNFTFYIVTLLIVLDLVTDMWVIVVFGQRKDTVFMGALAGLLILAGLIITVAYSAQHRQESDQKMSSLYVNLCLNFPFQIGIIYQRCVYGRQKCHHCCPRQIAEHSHIHGSRGVPRNMDWKFAKLKMIQSMFHCVPQLIGNMLHMLMCKDIQVIQIVSGVASFVSIIMGVVLHEKARKEQARGALMGIVKILCIFIYKTLVMGSRILAIVHFVYYFGGWMAVLLVPHTGIILGFYLYLYRQIWKVQYHTIILHSMYSMFAYFPIHCEYRPEGEIVLFYIFFMVENIIMVALPFNMTPPMPITRAYHPTSKYYFIVMLVILVGSSVGLIFMCVYYFIFHKSRLTIRETNLGWLGRLCEWRKQVEDGITVRVSNGLSHAGSPSRSRDIAHNGIGEMPEDLQNMDVTYTQTHAYAAVSTHPVPEGDADLSSNTNLLNANTLNCVTSSANPDSGSQRERLLVQSEVILETANKPSVMEGEDDTDNDQSNMVMLQT